MVQETQYFVSLITLDHNPKQENGILKGNGGAVRLRKIPLTQALDGRWA